MLHGPFSISLIGWVVSKGFFCFFSPFGLVALYTPCILSGVLQAFFIQLPFTYKKKKWSGCRICRKKMFICKCWNLQDFPFIDHEIKLTKTMCISLIRKKKNNVQPNFKFWDYFSFYFSFLLLFLDFSQLKISTFFQFLCMEVLEFWGFI